VTGAGVALHELSAADICWALAGPEPWPAARRQLELLNLAIEALPAIADDLAADLITELALTVADLQEEVNAVRAVRSGALLQARELHLEIRRLRQRVGGLLDARREARAAGA